MKSTQAQAAAQIRKFIKSIGIKASVRSESYAGGSSIRIHLTDQTEEVEEKINSFAKQFQYGSFDGQTDSYNYDNVVNGLPQVSYVFVENTISDEKSAEIWDNLIKTDPNIPLDAKPSDNIKFYGEWGFTIIHRVFHGTWHD